MANILVIDDHPTNRQFLSTVLGYSNHQVLEAGDGEEALRIVRKEHPDLIIADILLPTMDGYEFVHNVRGDPSISAIPVIFYTATYRIKEANALAASCGVEYVLAKLSDPEVIYNTVNKVLGGTVSVVPTPQLGNLWEGDLGLLTDALQENFQESKRTVARLAALAEVTLELVTQVDVPDFMEKFMRAARDIVASRFAAVGVMGDDPESLRDFWIQGLNREAAGHLGIPFPAKGAVSSIFLNGDPIRLYDPNGNLDPLSFPGNHFYTKSFLAVPLTNVRRTVGWLCFANKVGEDQFSHEDERLAVTLAAQFTAWYEMARLHVAQENRASHLENEIAERNRVVETLIKLSNAVEQSADSFVITDKKGTIEYVNPGFERATGFSKEEVLGKTPRILEPDIGDPEFYESIWSAIFAGSVFRGQFVHKKKNGELFFEDQTIAPIKNMDGEITHFVSTGKDITEQKRVQDSKADLEKQYLQSQKIEAIGQLAGGVAHDFNNTLMAISGYSELLLMQLPQDHSLYEIASEIHKCTSEGAKLTRQLLAFSQRQVLSPKVLDLNCSIAEMQNALHRLIGEDNLLSTVFAEDLGYVKVDPEQIEQVLMNLAVNAKDAMQNGGKLTIKTENVNLDEEDVKNHAEVLPGPYVLVAVRDTGCGMDETVLSHIFEPFYTTKQDGKGTGLGLSAVYGIVKQSGGHISVSSQEGIGTTFNIYFRRFNEKGTISRQPKPVDIEGFGETILLVDDNESIRKVVGELLALKGYKVLLAGRGKEALEIAQQHSGPIHLLISDLAMPEMGGRELAASLREMDPKLTILYMSGYTQDAISRQGILDPESDFISKPITMQNLLTKVREIIDSKCSKNLRRE